MTDQSRFRDNQETLSGFADEFLVVCPQCSDCARVVPRDRARSGAFEPRRAVCGACGYTSDWEGQTIIHGGEYDCYFRLPLWLQTPVGDKVLWAYNMRHLQFIEAYVRATLRERRADATTGWRNQSIASRLPDWIKAGKNRKQILKAIERIKHRYDNRAAS